MPKDIAWEHGTPIPEYKGGAICNYCGLIIKSGGVTRLKWHLAGTDPGKNVKACHLVPNDVKEEMRHHLVTSAKSKDRRRRHIEDIRSELVSDIIGEYDEDENEDEDALECPPHVSSYEKASFREAVRASKQSEWEREQRMRFPDGPGSSSRQSTGSSKMLQRSHTTREQETEKTKVSSIRKSNDKTHKGMLAFLKGKTMKESVGRLAAKFFIYDNVPASKANSHHFKNMVKGFQVGGRDVQPPSAHEIRTKYLDMEVEETKKYVHGVREKWKTYGCTIMCDGWTGPTKLSIINFMVYSKGTTVFLKSVDASDQIKDHTYIYGLMKEVVEEVGKESVVQVVTDNGSAYKKAGQKLMKRYPLYWTPCAAHCIDLIFEDIGKKERIKSVIDEGRRITNFIYNHGWLLAKMRAICNGDIVRPGATRFATNYMALESLLKKRPNLKALFTSEDWSLHKLSCSKVGKQVESLILSQHFWDNVNNICKILEPIYRVLRIVDSEVWPTMSCVYEAMLAMKEQIGQCSRNSNWILQIINDRWNNTLEHDLHAAAHFLNPKFQYSKQLGNNPYFLGIIHKVYETLDPHSSGQHQFGNEIIIFRDARNSFGEICARNSRDTLKPVDWWELYGSSAPLLQKLAIRILSQTASSSACERNWSTFALIHTKQRNRLAHKSLQNLVFCYYNMRLKVRDMEASQETDAQDPLNLLDISIEIGDEEDYPLFQWIRPVHLDDENRNPDPKIRSRAKEFGIDVDRVMSEEVGLEASSEDTSDGPPGFNYKRGCTSASTLQSFDDDDEGGDERGTTTTGSHGGGANYDVGYATSYGTSYEDGYRPYIPFTCEADFTHATQDEDHGSRGAGHGAKNSDFVNDFGSMSISTEYGSSSFAPSMDQQSSGLPAATQYGINEFYQPHSANRYPYCPFVDQLWMPNPITESQVDYSQLQTMGYLSTVDREANATRENDTSNNESCYFEPPRNSMWY